MRRLKKILRKINSIFFAILTIALPFANIMPVYAATAINLVNGGYVRSVPGTSGGASTVIGNLTSGVAITILDTVPTADGSTGCESGYWYVFSYNGTMAYSCTSNYDATNKYDRPWTSPKKAIIGGAIFKGENYISKGQFNSYLFKFNVNPASTNSPYTHQYMTNVRAVSSEARTSYQTYLENNLLDKTLVFTIPIFNNMPEYTTLSEGDPDTTGLTAAELNEPAFEVLLDAQGFDETYKKKLRILHKSYPAWVFESLKTNLDWNISVSAEQPVSYVDGSDVTLRETYSDAAKDGVTCKNASGSYCLKESTNWYLANTQTTAYYMDPRNFLTEQGVLMFEKLAYSAVYTEAVIQSRFESTFMSGISALDNQTYASIFVEAGRIANISAVYLASQCLQEVGVGGSMSTTGQQFTYNNVTYQGLFNFFNVGATDASSPASSGLVWANGGSTTTVVKTDVTPPTSEATYINMLGFAKNTGYLTGATLNQSVSTITNKILDATVTVTDSNGAALPSTAKLTTGSKVIVSDGTNTYTNTVVIYGDISGDGDINAVDLLYMRKFLLSTYNLTGSSLQAAKLAKGTDVGAADLLYLRKYLLDSQTYKITQ